MHRWWFWICWLGVGERGRESAQKCAWAVQLSEIVWVVLTLLVVGLPPLPPACCTFWLRLMEWNYTRGGKGNSVGPESEQSQIYLYRVIGIPHLDWQQRYLLPIPLHSVVDPALPCTSPISFMPLDQFTFEFLQFCTIEKSECKERIRVYPAGAEYRPAGVVGLLQTPRPFPL